MKLIILILSMFTIAEAKAQDIIIQPPVIPTFGCTAPYELYTCIVQNFSRTTFKTMMYVEINYATQTGASTKLADILLRGNPTADFSSGITVINGSNMVQVFPKIRSRYTNIELERSITQSKCLPEGKYEVCLTLYEDKGGDVNIPQGNFLTQTCYEREKEFLNNLFLVSPFDESTVSTKFPLFTWTPVIPYHPDGRYNLRLVEILDHQTAYDALVSNPAYYIRTNLTNNIHQFDFSSRVIDSCKTYAWQVNYTLKDRFGDGKFKKLPDIFQESEIWTFKTPCDNLENPNREAFSFYNPVYFNTKATDEGTYHEIKEDLLRFVYKYPYKTKSELQYDILDEKGNSILNNDPVYQETLPNQLPNLPEDCFYGENKFVMEFPVSIQSNKKFTLVIVHNGLKNYLRFVKSI